MNHSSRGRHCRSFVAFNDAPGILYEQLVHGSLGSQRVDGALDDWILILSLVRPWKNMVQAFVCSGPNRSPNSLSKVAIKASATACNNIIFILLMFTELGVEDLLLSHLQGDHFDVFRCVENIGNHKEVWLVASFSRVVVYRKLGNLLCTHKNLLVLVKKVESFEWMKWMN